MNSNRWILGLAVVAVIGMGIKVEAATYNAATQFSGVDNTDVTTWSYRYNSDSTRDGDYILFPYYTQDPRSGWSPERPYFWNEGSGDYTPILGYNNLGSDITHNTLVWPSETLFLHPGRYGQLAVLSWLSPTSAMIDISFNFSDIDSGGGNGVNWFVELNGASNTLASGNFGNGGSSGLTMLSNVAVEAGDRVNFILDMNGGYEYDSTGIYAAITQVPEPASLALWAGLGAMGLVAARRRKRAA